MAAVGAARRLLSDRLGSYRSLSVGERRTLLALGMLVLAGLVLRVCFMLAYRPAFLGYPDSGVYTTGARGELFWDPLRVVGYSVFLRLAHGLNSNLSFTILVQHGLGIATALFLYATVRRIGGPPWLGLVPAAVVLLGGDQLFFEHALLSETLYTFLTAAAVYAAARCLAGGRFAWPVACGVLLALAGTVRLAGVALLAIVVLWLLLVPADRPRGRLLRPAVAAAAGALVLFGYLLVAHDQTGAWSFARHGAYHFYGRAATFADCSKFDPPAGTEVLCENTPPSRRPSAAWYIFSGPVVRHFDEPQVGHPPPEVVDKVEAFAREAALHQPLDWLQAAARDFTRYVSPGSFKGPMPAPSTSDYTRAQLTDPVWISRNLPNAEGYWTTSGIFVRDGRLDALRDYESVTRIEGPPLAVLLVLALLAPIACRGRERRGALLLAGTGLALLVVPVVTIYYDGRFAVPSFGFVAAAAGLGAWGLAERVISRRAGRPRTASPR
jgi:hypothetical protein